MNINTYIQNLRVQSGLQKNSGVEETTGTGFLDTLKEKIGEVNDKQIEADNLTEKFIIGEEEDIHNVMLATEEAKMSLELAVQIRNKLVEAYEQFNRMQI